MTTCSGQEEQGRGRQRSKCGPNSDCLVCFLRQALNTARLTGTDETGQGLVIAATARLLPFLDLSLSPPENCLERPMRIDEYQSFRAAVTAAAGARVLYLADNSGEMILMKA